MKTVAIVTWPFYGHVYPTLSLGASLLSLGFRVVWICQIETVEYILPKGGEFIHLPWNTSLGKELEQEKPYGIQSLKDLYENTLLPMNEDIFHKLEAIYQDRKFDFIVTDQQAFAGALFAHKNGIPYATSVTTPATIDPSENFPEINAFEKSQVIKFQDEMGCPSSSALVWDSPITLVYTTECFLQKFDFPSSYYFVGPSISDRKEWNIDISAVEEQKGKRPIILVTMGTTQVSNTNFIEKVIAAFTDQNVAIVLVANPDLYNTWPENFHVYSYIPQLRILQLADAVICHAGHNTVCEALNFGIPMITIPIAYDQSYIATKVSNCGAGIRLKYRRLTYEGLRISLMEILTEPRYKIAAQKIQQSFKRTGGSKHAAELIASLLQSQTALAI